MTCYCCRMTTIPVLLFFIIAFTGFHTAYGAGVCYKSISYYERKAHVAYRNEEYGYYESCGFLGWKSCWVPGVRRISYTAYQSNLKHRKDNFCCTGYYGSPDNCKVETRIITNPIDIVVERGSTAQFTVKATGYGNFTYQWYHNSTILSSKTESNLYIYNSMEQNSGLYYCRVCNQDNNCASSTQAELTLSYNSPTITTHPSSKTVDLRTMNYNLSLSCQANGNIEYSWERFNGTLPNNINSSNASTLNFTFVSPIDAGKYRCRVSDSNGYYGYSNYGVVKINVPAPRIIKQPTNTTAAKPFGAHFTCTANGYGNIKIVWKSTNRDGTTPAKATITEERSLESVTSTLFIPDVVVADEGGYYCTAWIGRVSASSQTAYLQEIVTPMIQVKMDNNTVNLLVRNYNLTMRCLPSDTGLHYMWNRKNASLPTSAVGVNTSTMTIYRLTPEDAGDYQCVLSNVSGVIASEFDALKINVPQPEMLIPPENITAAVYTEITFSCTGRGFGDVRVVWTRPPSKVTDTAVYTTDRYDEYIIGTLTIPHVVDIYSGQYCCVIENDEGSSPRRCANLYVQVPCPEIFLSPLNNTIIVEEDAEFVCKAFSFGTIQYSWERMNSTLPAKASTDTCSSTLSIPNATQFDEGHYCCVATNECGTVKQCAMLSIIAIPIIILQPEGTIVHTGTDYVDMNCSAIGHSTIMYRWEKYDANSSEWNSLPTNQQTVTNEISTYRLTMLKKSDDGVYRCIATNIDGSGYSNRVTITVYDPPTIELSTTEIDAVEGQNITLTCTATNDVDSPYDAQVSWLGPMGQVITNNNRNFYISNIKLENVVTSALKMKPINHKQTGVNKCRATNHPSSSTEMSFTITVEYAPIIHITPSKSPYSTKIGPRFLLHCLAEGYPSPSVQWFKNGEPYSTLTSRSIQEIYVPRTSSSDSAVYECVGTNNAGNETQTSKASIDFKVTDPNEGPCGENNGGCDHICTADSGIARCFCRVGYFSIVFLPTKCFDVDECAYNLDKCEDTCINTPGSYKCSCPYGQVLASDGYSCLNCAVDESMSNFSHISAVIPVRISESLWHAAICKENNTICSGSLINDNSIITTANCICNDNSTTPEMVSVKMNKNYGCPSEENDAVEYSVTKIICHPSFTSASSAYNIAILKLASSVSTFSPICLPASKDANTFSVKSFAGIYDYGQSLTNTSLPLNSDVGFADSNAGQLQLQVTQIVVKSNCGANYTQPISSTDHILCTAAGSSGECWGKSGAPLVTHSSQPSKHFVLAGMVEADDCGSKAPYVAHIKLDGYQQWITDNLHP